MAWLILKWWEMVVSALLVGLGVDLSFPLSLIFGPDWKDETPEILILYAPHFLYGLAVILLIILFRREIYSYKVLKPVLEKAISNLSSDNSVLRTHAVQEILEVSRKSQSLHTRAMDALAQHLRERVPAPDEPDRRVEIKKQRFGPPSASVTQNYAMDIHDLARRQTRRSRENLSNDAAAVIEAFANRRRFFDDPRRWIDLSFTNLPSGNFEHGDFRQFSFAGANLRHANFHRANVSRASFDGAILNDAIFSESKAKETSFSSCMAHRMLFDQAKLLGAKFFGADLYDLSLQKADARNADFMGANMWRASAGLTDFKGAHFFAAKLQGADFRASKNLTKDQIYGARGFGAETDKNTRLPWSTEEELRASGVFRVSPRKARP